MALENLMVRRLRLERDRLARAHEEGANPYARPSEIIRRGTFPGSRRRGPSDPYLQPYDDMIAATATLIEQGRAGAFILEHQVDGRRVPVAVTKAQMEQVIVELVMLGELEPGDVARFVGAARTYSNNALDQLRTRHEILTAKRDRMASSGQPADDVTLAGLGDAMRGLGDPLDIGPIAARAAERARTMVGWRHGNGGRSCRRRSGLRRRLRPRPPPPPAAVGPRARLVGHLCRRRERICRHRRRRLARRSGPYDQRQQGDRAMERLRRLREQGPLRLLGDL